MTGTEHRPLGGFTAEEWDGALSWSEYMDSLDDKRDIWQSNWRRAEIKRDNRVRLQNLPGPRRVLILTEDWCGDAARSVPYLAKAFESSDLVEGRYLSSDRHPTVIDRYLSHGGRAIPIAIVQDEYGEELGAWGPRPAPLQEFFKSQWRMMGPPSEDGLGEFYRPILAWYARDDGMTVVSEILMLLERGGEPR